MVICLILLCVIVIGMINRPQQSNEDKIIEMFDEYVNNRMYEYGPFKFSDNTTIGEFKSLYYKYHLQPTVKYMLLDEYDRFCRYN